MISTSNVSIVRAVVDDRNDLPLGLGAYACSRPTSLSKTPDTAYIEPPESPRVVAQRAATAHSRSLGESSSVAHRARCSARVTFPWSAPVSFSTFLSTTSQLDGMLCISLLCSLFSSRNTLLYKLINHLGIDYMPRRARARASAFVRAPVLV